MWRKYESGGGIRGRGNRKTICCTENNDAKPSPKVVRRGDRNGILCAAAAAAARMWCGGIGELRTRIKFLLYCANTTPSPPSFNYTSYIARGLSSWYGYV